MFDWKGIQLNRVELFLFVVVSSQKGWVGHFPGTFNHKENPGWSQKKLEGIIQSVLCDLRISQDSPGGAVGRS